MRQFFSWRVWGAFVALALIAVGLKFVLPASASKDVAPVGPTPRTVQFISLVYAAKPSNTFAMDEGLVAGSIDLILDGQRTMHVY
ncbi:MAG: hypothetical protein JWL72_902, partial [Ilumatobacteraceae bacterium]|nr:hypothetical protein [Ilumatobacteraceae bacterium]